LPWYKRLAHALVLQRVLAFDVGTRQFVAMLVHAEEDGAVLNAIDHLEIGAGCACGPESCRLGSSTKSTSPDMSAATRVASDLMGV
jgi:hypothetical protein